MAVKVPDGLTIRISTNARDKTTKILAYRKGRFKYAYKATIPMCTSTHCRVSGPHTTTTISNGRQYKKSTLRHQADVDMFVRKLIKSYT